MISINQSTIGGEVFGEPIRGQEPIPWAIITVKTRPRVWDRSGSRVTVSLSERIVIQARENIESLIPRLHSGIQVIVIGQRVPASVVVADSDIRGSVVLADVFQIAGDCV